MNKHEINTSMELLENFKKALHIKRIELIQLTEELKKIENDYKTLIVQKEQKLNSLEREIKSLTEGIKFIFIDANKSNCYSNEFVYEKNPPSTVEMKNLYKRLVKKVHPDLCYEENEKLEKNKILTDVNKAYSENDYSTLLEIWNDIDDSVNIEDKIKLLKDELEAIDEKLINIKSSSMFKLKIKSDVLNSKGINYIQSLSNNLDNKIKAASEKLSHLRDMNIINKYF